MNNQKICSIRWFNMKKIIIIGSPGAGKSMFARKLSELTGHPLFYLDLLWHKEDKTAISRSEFDKELSQILSQDRWIIDGNYIRTLEIRLKYCDTVYLLDIPLEVCLQGVENRIGKKRADMPWVELEFDADFKQWIKDFPKNQLPIIYNLLNKYKEKKVFIFKDRAEANNYLKSIH